MNPETIQIELTASETQTLLQLLDLAARQGGRAAAAAVAHFDAKITQAVAVVPAAPAPAP